MSTLHALFIRQFELSKLVDNVKCLYIYFQVTYFNSVGKCTLLLVLY